MQYRPPNVVPHGTHVIDLAQVQAAVKRLWSTAISLPEACLGRKQNCAGC